MIILKLLFFLLKKGANDLIIAAKGGYLEVIITMLINSTERYDKIKKLNFIIDQMKIEFQKLYEKFEKNDSLIKKW